MKKLIILCLSLILLSGINSCTQSNASAVKEKMLPPALPPLSSDEVFNEDRVYDYLFDNKGRATDSLETASKAEFLKAIDLFKNKKQIDQSIPLFVKSLEIFPAAKTYNELGDAYFTLRQFDKAIQCYKIAIRLNYKPLGETYFHMACIESNTKEYHGNTGEFLNLALRNGFSDSARFVSEPMLQKFKGTGTYSQLFMKYFINGKTDKNPHFQAFKFSFQKLPETFSIEENEVGAYSYNNELSYEYSDFIEEMENVSFGRDVSNIFTAVGIAKETPEYTLVLYKSVEMYADFPPVYTMMATYNSKTGELIDKKVFACNCSATDVKTGKIENNTITVVEKERVWEKPITEVGIEENKVLEFKIKSTSQYSIQQNGKIQLLPSTASL